MVWGDSESASFVYLDRPAGNYTISTITVGGLVIPTELRRSLSLTLAPGQVRYVRLGMTFGLTQPHVYPELVENAEAETQMAHDNCRLYLGQIVTFPFPGCVPGESTVCP
jgi:hypothetical protein